MRIHHNIKTKQEHVFSSASRKWMGRILWSELYATNSAQNCIARWQNDGM